MSTNSKIEWTEASWNPVTGCTKISPGCDHCYAERLAHRLKAMGQDNYRNAFNVTLHEHMLGIPFTWKKPQVIFVNSMSDLFHKKVPEEFIEAVFKVMREAQHHTFQVLTKRARRLAQLAQSLEWPKNVWMGVSVETIDYSSRIDMLRQTPAHVKFLSLEPLLGSMPSLNLKDIDWVIVGGESGPGARPLKPQWVREIRDQCIDAGVPFFFKQWGGVNKKKTGRELDGCIYEALPNTKRVA